MLYPQSRIQDQCILVLSSSFYSVYKNYTKYHELCFFTACGMVLLT